MAILSSPERIRQPRLTLSSTVEWATSANPLPFSVIGFVAVYPFLIGLLQEAPPGFELPINVHLYDLLGGLGVAATLLILRWFRTSPGSTFWVWLSAGCAGVALQLGVSASAGEVPDKYFTSIPFGVLSFMGLLFAATIIRHVFLELRGSSLELAERRYELLNLKANLENRLLKQKQALDLEVKQKLEAHILAIRAQIEQLAAEGFGGSADQEKADKISGNLRLAIDKVVRPLSIEIANSTTVDVDSLPNVRQLRKRIRRLSFVARMSSLVPLGYVFNLPLTAAFLVIFVLPSYVFLFGLFGFILVSLPATLLSLTVLWLLNRVTRKQRVPYVLAGLLALVVSFINALPFVLFGSLALPTVDHGILVYLAFAAFLINLGSAFSSLFIETAYVDLAQARVDNTETRKLVAYLQSQSQINRRTMAQVVHGKVQARLQAASIRLQQASSFDDQLVREVTADLDAALLDTTETQLGRASLSEQLSEMAVQWEGICDLSFVFEPGSLDAIDGNNRTKTSVVEIIREAVNNAVKHGEADEAEATIAFIAPDAIRIVVRNSVYSSSAVEAETHVLGYGSKMLDQITDEWHLNFTEGDAILTATLKLTQ